MALSRVRKNKKKEEKRRKKKKFTPFLLAQFTANHMATNWEPPAQTTGAAALPEPCKTHQIVLNVCRSISVLREGCQVFNK